MNDLIDKLRVYLKGIHSSNNFLEIRFVPKNRVLRPQLILLHKPSNIECVLICEDRTLIKAARMINSYCEMEPMCT